jgi:hypothetical protein
MTLDEDEELPNDLLNEEREFNSNALTLKPIFIEAVQELYDEVDLVQEGVAAQASEHIHSGYVCRSYNSPSLKKTLTALCLFICKNITKGGDHDIG